MNTPGTVIDLVAGFNADKGTTYTRADLLGAHISEFMKYIASEIKIVSERLTDLTGNYHAQITGKGTILRHTPKNKQKMLMYNPVFIKAESDVYSTLFNPKYLEIGDFEGVNYWQSLDNPTKVAVKPNILNVTNGESKNAANQTIDYVLGILFDVEALGVTTQFDYASTTPMNSAGGYFNTYYHWKFNDYVDYTENMILFVLGEGGTGA